MNEVKKIIKLLNIRRIKYMRILKCHNAIVQNENVSSKIYEIFLHQLNF